MPDGYYDRKSDEYWSSRRQPAPQHRCVRCDGTGDVNAAQDPFFTAGRVTEYGAAWNWWCSGCLRQRREELKAS